MSQSSPIAEFSHPVKTVLFNRFCLDAELAQGSFGSVYKTTFLPTNEQLAVKILSKSKNHIMFLKMEILALNDLKTHPHIITTLEMQEDDDYLYLFQEFCAMGDLYDAIPPLIGIKDEHKIKKYFSQVIDAVSYMHSKGYVHRDIKPENVMLDAQDNVRLIDFGLCGIRDSPDTYYGSCVGTFPYMAPEIYAPSPKAKAMKFLKDEDLADIWSLGILLYTMLEGEYPWGRPTHNDYQFECYFTHGKRFDKPDWEEPLHELMCKMLELFPRRRIGLDQIARYYSEGWLRSSRQPPRRMTSNLTFLHDAIAHLNEKVLQSAAHNNIGACGNHHHHHHIQTHITADSAVAAAMKRTATAVAAAAAAAAPSKSGHRCSKALQQKIDAIHDGCFSPAEIQTAGKRLATLRLEPKFASKERLTSTVLSIKDITTACSRAVFAEPKPCEHQANIAATSFDQDPVEEGSPQSLFIFDSRYDDDYSDDLSSCDNHSTRSNYSSVAFAACGDGCHGHHYGADRPKTANLSVGIASSDEDEDDGLIVFAETNESESAQPNEAASVETELASKFDTTLKEMYDQDLPDDISTQDDDSSLNSTSVGDLDEDRVEDSDEACSGKDEDMGGSPALQASVHWPAGPSPLSTCRPEGSGRSESIISLYSSSGTGPSAISLDEARTIHLQDMSQHATAAPSSAAAHQDGLRARKRNAGAQKRRSSFFVKGNAAAADGYDDPEEAISGLSSPSPTFSYSPLVYRAKSNYTLLEKRVGVLGGDGGAVTVMDISEIHVAAPAKSGIRPPTCSQTQIDRAKLIHGAAKARAPTNPLFLKIPSIAANIGDELAKIKLANPSVVGPSVGPAAAAAAAAAVVGH